MDGFKKSTSALLAALSGYKLKRRAKYREAVGRKQKKLESIWASRLIEELPTVRNPKSRAPDRDIGPLVIRDNLNGDRCHVCGRRDNLLPFAVMPNRIFLGTICRSCAHEVPCSPERSPFRVIRFTGYGVWLNHQDGYEGGDSSEIDWENLE